MKRLRLKVGNMKDRKNFYKSVFALVIPMAMQNLINVGVTSTDVFMLGKVGAASLSGASLAGQVQFIMTLLFFGISSGSAVLIAQYWGKKDLPSIQYVFGIAMKCSFFIAICFTLAAQLCPSLLMRIFTNDPDVIREGTNYLRIVSISYLFISLTMIYLNTMRSIERVLISTVVYFCSLLINIILNSILIFGLLGLPKMGVTGAAIATLIARICEFLMICFYNKRINKELPFHFSFLKQKNGLLKADFIKYSFPVVLNELMWGAGVAANSAILGHLGSSVTAANSVAQVTRQLALVIGFGISNAAAIMIGKAIGEHKEDLAKEYGTRFAKLSIMMGLFGTVVVMLARPIIMSIMEIPPDSMKYLSTMMYIMAVFVIAQSYNSTMIVGIFRGGGDTKFGLIVDVTSMWFGSILLGLLASYVFKLPVEVVYLFLMSDEFIKIPLTTIRYKSRCWLRNVTRTT